jgi:hypothetical protein
MLPTTYECRSNLPPSVMVGLRNHFGLTQFVETGTCWGQTTLLAALAFPKVLTVEDNPEYWKVAAAALRHFPNVTVRLGDSETVLKEVDWAMAPPTLFYLDAHRDSIPLHDSPLPKELGVIRSLHGKHVVIMDDWAREHVERFFAGWSGIYWFNAVCENDFHWCAVTPARAPWSDWLPV